jgi:hypothetical protein
VWASKTCVPTGIFFCTHSQGPVIAPDVNAPISWPCLFVSKPALVLGLTRENRFTGAKW